MRRAVEAVWWYLREVSGENDYARYVAHARLVHADSPVVSRREFERLKTAQRELHPAARCC